MAIGNDWTINTTAKTISHTSGTEVYTVLALYTWLMDTFDELDYMDDPVPMSAQTPTEFTLINGWDFGTPATDVNYLKGGAITRSSDNTVWSNVYTIGSDSVISNIYPYIVQDGSVIWTASSGGHIDKLVMTRDAGTLVDSGKVTVFAREYQYTYDHYVMDLSSGGRQPAPLAVAADANNTTASGTVAAYNIDVSFGTYAVDVTGNSVNENYEVELDLNNTHTVAEAYEYVKYLTRRGETSTLNSVQGQIYTAADASSPTDPAATYSEKKSSPLGTFAGGKFFGARGVHFKLAERPASQANLYELIDSDNNSGITEPTSVTIQVTSLDTDDAVFVALASSGSLVTDQYTTTAGDNDTSDTEIVFTTTLPNDTPSSGTVRVGASRKKYSYSSWNGTTLTLDATAHPTGLEEDQKSADAFIPWIDRDSGQTAGPIASTSVSYVSDREVIIRVRQYGIIPFESPGTISSTGLSVAAIRTDDGVIS